MSVRRRLKRLEGAAGPCSKCGIDPSVPPVYEVVWETLGEPSVPEESSPPCPLCGQRKLIVIRWPEVPESGVPDYPLAWDRGEGLS